MDQQVRKSARRTRLLAFVVALAALAYAAWSFVRNEFLTIFVQDALLTASDALNTIEHQPGEVPSAAAVDAVFAEHHHVSVSPIWFDPTGRPVDGWGTPFRAVIDAQTKFIICESAGPDREFGTSDDLRACAR